MHAALGIPLSLVLAALVMYGTATLHRELWWFITPVIALIVAADAWRGRLSRYPSRFPLHPAGAFLATFLVWPISLPWYLHTKWRIRTGRLTEDSPRPRQGCVYAVLVVVALAVLWGAIASVGDKPILKDLEAVARAVQRVSPARFYVNLNNGSYLTVTVDTVPVLRADSLRNLAWRLASVAYFSLRDSSRLRSVTVVFRTVTRNGLVTYTRSGPTFGWPTDSLDTTRGHLRAVVPN